MIRFNLSPNTRALADALLASKPDEVLTFDMLSAAIGRDIRTCRHLLQSAARVAQRESGVSFANVIRVGYRRLAAEDVPAKMGGAARKRIRGEARRASGAIKAASSSSNGLPPAAARRANAELGVLGLIGHLAQDREVKRMLEVTSASATIRPTSDFLSQIGAAQQPA